MLTFFLVYAGVAFAMIVTLLLHWFYRTIRPGKHPLFPNTYNWYYMFALLWPFVLIGAVMLGILWLWSKVIGSRREPSSKS